jgi:hypothetical protein
VKLEHTVELYEDPDQWSFWEVIEWDNPNNKEPGEHGMYLSATRSGKILHRVRGNDWTSEMAAREWLHNYKKENGIG